MDPSALDRQVGRSQRGWLHNPGPSRGRPPHPTLLPKPTILPAPDTTLTVEPARLIHVEIPAPALQANMLGDPALRCLAISLPPSYYQCGRSYPVVYFLPRFGDDERAFANGNYGIVLPRTVDAVMAGGSVRELIVVVVKGRSAAGGSFYVNSPLTGNWEGFVVRDVVTYVDRMCRALAHPDWRGIAGHSISGFGGLQLAMSHPKTFGAVYGLSPGLFAPGGLEESQTFRDPLANDDLLAMIGQLRGPDAEKAAAMFKAAPARLAGDERFTLAYGMAFAPEVQAAPPYTDLPYERSGAGLRARRFVGAMGGRLRISGRQVGCPPPGAVLDARHRHGPWLGRGVGLDPGRPPILHGRALGKPDPAWPDILGRGARQSPGRAGPRRQAVVLLRNAGLRPRAREKFTRRVCPR